MEQGNPLCGGVSLCHSLVDDKHCYKVENALTHCSSTFRKGDVISMINNMKTQDLSPMEFIGMLSSEAPILTIHQTNIDTEEAQCLESDSIHACRIEETRLNFQLAMVREEGLKADGENGMGPTESMWESDDDEDKNLFLVSMSKTNVAFVRARGCDCKKPCDSCGINECEVNEVIVASENRTVTSVSSQSIMMNTKRDVVMCSLVQIWSCKNVAFSENITIYYYCSNIAGDLNRGSPVVLNLTGTKNFLKCTCKDQKIVLTIESYETIKLQNICKDDPAIWPFVFYMKTTRANHRLFESAAHQGWFIQTEKPVSIGCRKDETQENFYFLLYSKKK